ncbi:MAG: transcription elongation factor GreA [Candidatus Cloacimonetes bacterium]|nr:transcription elongation factor GreA [Candidatus Cloacimonadota bacterium]
MANYITKEGMQRLRLRIQELIDQRAIIIKQVVEAREMGDLSENAEYHAAREKQRDIENEFNNLNKRMSCLMVIDPDNISKDTARFGAKVCMQSLEDKQNIYLRLVGVDEVYKSDDEYERTSILSPRGKAVIGKKVGDIITVRAPKGVFEYKIISIQ